VEVAETALGAILRRGRIMQRAERARGNLLEEEQEEGEGHWTDTRAVAMAKAMRNPRPLVPCRGSSVFPSATDLSPLPLLPLPVSPRSEFLGSCLLRRHAPTNRPSPSSLVRPLAPPVADPLAACQCWAAK
jgi:hypothetical protein